MGCFFSRKKVLPNPTNQSRTRNRTAGRRKTNDGRDLSCREVSVNTIVQQRYTIFSSIGKGEFGHVVRAEHKHTKIPYAIKIIDLTNDIKELEKSQLELAILSKVKHKYVIQLHDVIKTPRRLYLVMDLATGGELMDRICLYGNFDEYDATRVLTMILDGLQYLHSLGITHRDLKPQNILYYHPGNDSKIVITDFGLSAMRDRASSPANYLMKTDCGTIEYMAPEVITRARYTNAVDMWSMGVIAYIVLSGRLPFPLNGNVLSTLRMICFCKYNFEGQPWGDISDDAKDFISSLLVFDPSKRLLASEALEHKWIKGKHHKKLNLQRSISSNWNDSCLSLKNEKGLKRHTRAKERDSTNSKSLRDAGNPAKGKPSYGAIYRSRDDTLHKGWHGKTKVSEGDKGTQKDASTAQNDVDKLLVVKCMDSNTTYKSVALGCESKDVHKSTMKRADDKTSCVRSKYTDEKVKTNPKVLRTDPDLNAIDPHSQESKSLACYDTTNVQRKASKQYRPRISPEMASPQNICKQDTFLAKGTPPSDQDCNGNFVKSFQPSTRHAELRMDDTQSSRWNLADAGDNELPVHVTERTPLKKEILLKPNNRLPPIIKTPVTPMSTVNNALKK